MADADVRAAAMAVLRMYHEGHIVDALARADALADEHLESAIAHRLVGDLRYAEAIRIAGTDDKDWDKKVDQQLSVAHDALITARSLAPNCVDIAAALGDMFCASKLYNQAEIEFRRAQSLAFPSDPAENNARYGMYQEEVETTAAERVEEARERARRSYARMTVERVLDTAAQHGARAGREHGKGVAEASPNLARAQYLNAYMDLEFVRGLDASIDRRAFLRRTLVMAERAAQAFPNSAVIASFHARLLFLLGEYHAAEGECRRALSLKEPDDPQHDCIPPGSISGENRCARLVSLASQFHELLKKILMLANDYWSSMSSERREAFLSVRLDALQDEYSKVDCSSSITMSDVQRFVKDKGSWWFWVCPICDSNSNRFLEPGSLLSHMCSKHPGVVVPRLQSVLDPKLSEKALEGDGYLGGVSLAQDSDQKDVIKFDKRSEAFKWLFYAPSSGIGPEPFLEFRESRRHQGNMVLESIKEKMKTLPANKSTTEFAEALPEINELWLNFLRTSVIDYRAFILTIARTCLWNEMKKFMTEDHKAAAKFIDIDAIFTKEDDTDQALKTTNCHGERKGWTEVKGKRWPSNFTNEPVPTSSSESFLAKGKGLACDEMFVNDNEINFEDITSMVVKTGPKFGFKKKRNVKKIRMAVSMLRAGGIYGINNNELGSITYAPSPFTV